MVPSSSEDGTRAMRGEPKRLSRNYLRRNGGNVIVFVLISFHRRDVFCTLSRLFVRPGFRLFGARFYLAVHSLLRSLIKLNFNSNGNDGCVSLRYNSLFISLPVNNKICNFGILDHYLHGVATTYQIIRKEL